MSTPIEVVRALIAAESDVKRVLEIVQVGERFRYLIETPFATYPKFVIGSTDAELNDVRLQFKCGLECNARREWDHLLACPVKQTIAP